MTGPTLPSRDLILADARRALAEDVGTGDLTANLVSQKQVSARLVARESGVLSGTGWFDAVFELLDPGIRISWKIRDGQPFAAEDSLCVVEGSSRPILTGERAAMNFLQTLSGTATTTARFVTAVAGTGVEILDTRKTIPGLRNAQKYAVTCGGGRNHRMGLFDAILIKENHIASAGSIQATMERARDSGNFQIEIEVESLSQLSQALAAGAKRILLDNFSVADLRSAVAETGKRAQLEASGGITLENVREIAGTGVDFISVGSLTKNVAAIDLSLRFNNL